MSLRNVAAAAASLALLVGSSAATVAEPADPVCEPANVGDAKTAAVDPFYRIP